RRGGRRGREFYRRASGGTPERDPQEAHGAGGDERRAPSPAQGDPRGEHGREHGAEADGGLVHRVSHGAFAGLCIDDDGLACGWNAAGLGRAEQRTAYDETPESAGEAGGYARAGPESEG